MPYKDPQIAKEKAKERKRRWRTNCRPDDWTDSRGKHNNHSQGSNHYRWNQARIVTSHGYVKVRVDKAHHLADPNGYAYEHRVVAESMLNRALDGNEVVHHINHDIADNRPVNLEIMTRGAHGQAPAHPRERDSNTGRFVGKKAAGALLDGREWREMPGMGVLAL